MDRSAATARRLVRQNEGIGKTAGTSQPPHSGECAYAKPSRAQSKAANSFPPESIQATSTATRPTTVIIAT